MTTCRELLAALRRLEVVTRSYLRYPLEGEEPGYDAKDVLAYCDEARAFLAQGCDAEAALGVALAHCEELRDAWERGALDEHDGKGGLRANRNFSVVLALRAALSSPAQGGKE